MKSIVRLLACVGALVWLLVPLHATTVRVMNLEEMVASADRVFFGRCVMVKQAPSKGLLPVIEYRFEVLRPVKGVQQNQTVVFRQIGGGAPGAPGIPGMPGFKRGQQLLLFLNGDSRLGLTSPVGLMQGVFDVRRGDGRLVAVNGIQNRNLATNLSMVRARQLGLSASQKGVLDEGGPIALELLEGMVKEIDRSLEGKLKSIQ